jgi:outer membrane protein OmpA-like peptidoglycan-associated protein
MLGLRTPARRGDRDEAEKPFWISFSDLMTALMVLFLVAMAVALIGVTQGIRRIEAQKQLREDSIQSCVTDMVQVSQRPEFRGVKVQGQTIEFGSLAEFRKGGNDLSPERQHFLRSIVPHVLDVARHDSCKTWLKRVIVEGFASQEGSYLHNLNLSLERSQRVLCVLLDAKAPDAPSLEDRKLIRQLFLVGGSSFNAAILDSPVKSRRVELRLEFHELPAACAPGDAACQARREPPPIPWDEESRCPVITR